jgi:hypothetical protein
MERFLVELEIGIEGKYKASSTPVSNFSGKNSKSHFSSIELELEFHRVGIGLLNEIV